MSLGPDQIISVVAVVTSRPLVASPSPTSSTLWMLPIMELQQFFFTTSYQTSVFTANRITFGHICWLLPSYLLVQVRLPGFIILNNSKILLLPRARRRKNYVQTFKILVLVLSDHLVTLYMTRRRNFIVRLTNISARIIQENTALLSCFSWSDFEISF